MFNCMNRTVYYTIKYFVLYFGGAVVVLTGIGYISMFLEYISATYGGDVAKAFIMVIVLIGFCIAFAYNRAREVVLEQDILNDKVEKALKGDRI